MSTDQRATERLPVNANTRCIFVAPVREDFGSGRIKDISVNGLGLLMAQRPEVGTLLAVTLSNATRSFNKTVLVRVQHVTPAQGLFLIGGTFEVPLKYEEWTALVM
jgi:hypothetical protein